MNDTLAESLLMVTMISFAVTVVVMMWQRRHSSNSAARRLGATLRQAATIAGSTAALVAFAKRTFVLPPRPQPPGTGTKTPPEAEVNLRCCCGVSLTMAQPRSG